MSDYLTDGSGGTEKTFPPHIQKRIDAGHNCWSSIGKGWLPILVDLDEKLSKISPDYVIHQVKEKFGLLRIYVGGFEHLDDMDPVDSAITLAESISSRTCEICGKPGKQVSPNGWITTRCEEHIPVRE